MTGGGVSGGPPRLVLTAHGSTDPRFADVVDAVAARVRDLRPGLDVAIGHLEHGPPLAGVVTPGCVVVPLLLSSGYHVRSDIPTQAPGAVVARAVGPDARLAQALADRLREAGWSGGPVVLAAAGSADERALDDVREAARSLADRLGAEVRAAFVSAGSPRLADLTPRAVASYLLAPGVFQDALSGSGAPVVAAPIADHPALAEIVLDRYDEAAGQVPGRTAPA
jgi:sirohydrochlorin ferrochelatase